MIEVTIKNFDSVLPQIESVINDASFIALDCEFTGIKSSDTFTSLCDTPEQRYVKDKHILSQFLVCQLGLSAFKCSNDESNMYTCQTFTFYLFPRTFGAHDQAFTSQASALEFLTIHSFDFNKFIHDGVPYLNRQQEERITRQHADDNIHITSPSDVVRQIDETIINPGCKQIEEWFNANMTTNPFVIVDAGKTVLAQYLLLKRIQSRFKEVQCSFPSVRELKIERYISAEGTSHLDDSYERLYARLIERSVGFSNVLKLISKSEKPVVGHNFFKDSLMIVDKFHTTLPDSYKAYKIALHKLFPVIFDTKCIAFQLRRMFKDVDFFGNTGLEGLYSSMSSSAAMFYKLYSPIIAAEERSASDNSDGSSLAAIHHAGYDAFITGYVFIRMAHIVAMKDARSEDMKPLTWMDHFINIKHLANQINFSRATVRFINIAGPDPDCECPVHYLVTIKNHQRKIDANEIVQQFLGFGTVDCNLVDHTQARVSLLQRRSTRNVVDAFRRHRLYRVVKYNSFIHSKMAIRCWLFLGVSLSVVAVGGLIYYVTRDNETTIAD